MNSIRARCEEHGDVSLGTNDVTVYVTYTSEYGWYDFLCPSEAREFVTKRAELRTIDLLVASGVKLVTIDDTDMMSDRAKLDFVSKPVFSDMVVNAMIDLQSQYELDVEKLDEFIKIIQ